MDTVSRQKRSSMMAGIRSSNTKPEVLLRKLLHARGLRFRLVGKRPRGRPDIVLKRHRVAIFVHGCFWHRHAGCRYAYVPKSNVGFWTEKFAANVARDARIEAELVEAGWRVLVVWECALRRPEGDRNALANRVITWIGTTRRRGELPLRVRAGSSAANPRKS